MHRSAVLLLAMVSATLLAAPGAIETSRMYSGWPTYGGGADNIHYSSLRQIDTANVRQLEIAWTFETGDAFGDGANASEMEYNPIVVGEVMYVVSPKLRLFALDAANGKPLWVFDPNPGEKVISKQRLRGVSYWTDGRDARIFMTSRSFLLAVDARTGKAIGGFGTNGRVDLREGLGRDPRDISVGANSPGVVYKDLLIMGTTGWAPGHIRAYDVRTGQIRWTFHTIPQPGEFGYETWPKDAWKTINGANAWAGMAVDEKRGILFVPTASAGQGDKDFFGGDRQGDNLFANSLVALDAATGKRLWHFQAVHHDLWDYDFPAPPSLVTVRRDGRMIDAVAQTSKQGFVYVFDRVTGAPLFPIVERPVPPSTIPGEHASPTQPFPLLPTPFARQGLSRKGLTQRTPAAAKAAAERLDQFAASGLFSPPSFGGTLIAPGTDGGAEWGGSAFDPETGLLYVNSNEKPSVLQLGKRSTSPIASGRAIYEAECAACHGADRQGSPPEFPSLVGVGDRLTKFDVFRMIGRGGGRMPSFEHLGNEGIGAVADYIVYNRDTALKAGVKTRSDAAEYSFAGYGKLSDPDGYPGISPPWGTLSAIDLNSGRYAWRRNFGEYPDLAAKGLRDTGSDNYGGGVVTAGGLFFIGATIHDRKFRAYDKRTGKLLWETLLPAAGNATPAIYEADGRQFVVIAAGGGKTGVPGQAPGGSFIAFALPERRAR
ncbi:MULTISPECIES: outer membrane protein assembly factor BamB family protein [unclassified Sphingomonas]|uniref:outer membrane protein assembly factor BamB family protein n=1 Tax=unclassified Sphingomonas TaxID=196159 RepID=UPI0006FF91B6|nr:MULTISPECIES: PQQ-binding-like beta-propeller repeat protein [unclassified Sphingomonas]KQX22593.1 pyrrolo-quinoline quinone [Sphingomonas sp. Root1294]KQY67929.1 pyrrolo-quinoline quinone [Sphingomonas sp. Root50]KRB88853.1 pyrrolo-quinoline quinone [Sphingomonas sp. Root720]